eukprot:12920548-Alexandrium_andersonii.AAC.1
MSPTKANLPCRFSMSHKSAKGTSKARGRGDAHSGGQGPSVRAACPEGCRAKPLRRETRWRLLGLGHAHCCSCLLPASV